MIGTRTNCVSKPHFSQRRKSSSKEVASNVFVAQIPLVGGNAPPSPLQKSPHGDFCFKPLSRLLAIVPIA